MSNIIIDWDSQCISGSELTIIDVYTTNLIEIPLDEFDLADYAYYEALNSHISEKSTSQILRNPR